MILAGVTTDASDLAAIVHKHKQWREPFHRDERKILWHRLINIYAP